MLSSVYVRACWRRILEINKVKKNLNEEEDGRKGKKWEMDWRVGAVGNESPFAWESEAVFREKILIDMIH